VAADIEFGPVRFADDSAESSDPRDADEPDDLLQVGRDRRAPALLQRIESRVWRVRLVLRWAVATIASVSVLIIFGLGSSTAHRPTRAGTSTTAAGQPTDPDISNVLATARNSQPLVDYIRSDSVPGACALVPVGRSPQRSVAAAVRRAFPEYEIYDVGRILDQLTAMCAINLRAYDAGGSVLVIEIVAPQNGAARPFTALNVELFTDGTTTVSMTTAVTTTGWSVTVGTVGPISDQPLSTALLHLAQDPSLVW
jgi:hypothetical protein